MSISQFKMFLFKCKVSLKLNLLEGSFSMTVGITGYSNLNGLGLITGATSGYGGYGYYGALTDSTYVDNAKTSIANNYEIRSTNQSYTNLQKMQQSSFNLKCQNIKFKLQDGRSDDAVKEFNELVQQMSQLSQYQACDESDIITKIHNEYATACGSTLLGDISRYSDSSFISGVKNSNPLSVFLCQSSSKADVRAQVTGDTVSNADRFIKCAGAAAGGAGVALAGSALLGVRSAYKHAKSSSTTGKFAEVLGATANGVWDKVKNLKGSKVKWIAIAGAVIGFACVAGKWLLNKATDNSASA